MTDYRDGKWHEWGGGDCPVGNEDIVEVVLRNRRNEGGDMLDYGGNWAWPHGKADKGAEIILFRVVKRGPREFYANDRGKTIGMFYLTEQEARDNQSPDESFPIIKLREVID